jgi:hypothetical protein
MGDGRGARGDQGEGLFAVRRQMQIGEQGLAGAQPPALLELRLLDLHDHVGGGENLRGIGGDRGPRGTVMRVVEADACAGAGLHQDLMAGIGQLAYAGRHQADPVFVNLDFLRYADLHRMAPVSVFDRDGCVTSSRSGLGLEHKGK